MSWWLVEVVLEVPDMQVVEELVHSYTFKAIHLQLESTLSMLAMEDLL
jgi:hypothetical protein